MNRDQRHRLIQRILWSPLGFGFLRWSQRFGRRWNYVVLNRSLHSETNGEYWLISQLSAKPLVYDVGFNTGDFSREVLRLRPEARVVGFDPARAMQRLFVQNFGSDRRLKFESIALADKSGEAQFYDSDSMSSSLAPDRSDQISAYTVPVKTLDDYVADSSERIELLKIDAEGFDLNVLEGASRILKEQKIDLFLFEYADGWLNNRRLLRDAARYLDGKPYTLHRLFNGFISPFAYDFRHERYDLGNMFIGISHERARRMPLPIRQFPD